MPTISVTKNDLLHLLGKTYTVAELIPLLDYVKGELKEYSPETDELKIELKDTNRPDLWCPEGITRQIRCMDAPLDYADMLALSSALSAKTVLVDPNIQPVRPYIGAFLATGAPVTEEFLIQMIQTQEKLCDGYGKKRELLAIGIYNAAKIVFPVHYKAVAPEAICFVPLGYDAEMNLAEILASHPKGIEFADILRGQTLYPILVDDRDDVLSFPPVINSRTSGEVQVGDQQLFIEITGMDLNFVLHAVNILAYNFKDRGFTIEPVSTVYPYATSYGQTVSSPYPLRNEVDVEYASFEKYLGTVYSQDDILRHLRRYGLIVTPKSTTTVTVATYPYRFDYMHAVDAIEDLAIAAGYDTFTPVMPERFTVGSLAPLTLFEDRVRETMIGFGFEEVILNILSNPAEFDERVQGMYRDLVQISNPMTETYAALRNTLIPSLLNVEAQSSQALYPHKVFEVGEVVVRDAADNHGCATQSRLAGLLAHAEANFSELGSYLTHLSYLLFWEMRLQAREFPIFIAGRSGEILVGERVVGLIGEVHPAILETWGMKMPTVLFEVNLTALAGFPSIM